MYPPILMLQVRAPVELCFLMIQPLEIAKTLFSSVKQEIIVQLGVGAEESVQGQSTEMHKEVTDKNYMRRLLVSLSGDELFETVS